MLAKKKEYDLLMFILSLYVLIEISIEFVVKFPSQLTLITSWIDNLICILFLIDWIYYLISAPKKRTYLFTHIFDLISSIPSVPGLRIFRFLRILRFLRGFKGIIKLWKLANKKPMESSLISYVVYMVTISFYCTLAYYKYELPVNKGLESFSDAMWLTFTTLTTIGYGDIYPMTTEGRVVSAILMVTGTGFFALLSGEIATIFIKSSSNVENR